MFAGWLMTIAVVFVIAYGLYRFLSPGLDKMLIPEAERLEEKRERLRVAQKRMEVLRDEVDVTQESNDLEDEIVRLREELKELGG